jgi:hypothetical protein
MEGRWSAVELHIEHLVLQGLPGDRSAIAAAVEQELARLLAERGLPPGLGEGDTAISVSSPVVRVPAGLRPEAIGARVAEAIYANVAGGPPAQQEKGGSI